MSRLGPLTLGTLSQERRPFAPPLAQTREEATRRSGSRGAAIRSLIDETAALYRTLRRGFEEVCVTSGGQRDVLRELDRQGPRTVPQMARSRSVSRQHVQSHVNELASQGYVVLVDNPAHKRSRLVELTEEGKRLILETLGSEAQVLAQLDVEASIEDIAAAVKVLRRVRTSLCRPRRTY